MTHLAVRAAALALLFAVGACAIEPYGSSYAAMPSPYKPPEVFSSDEGACSAYARQVVAGHADTANQQAILTTLLGAAIGAGIGEAVGGGREVTAGAVGGAITGGMIGAANSTNASYALQHQYDVAYQQCMYNRGNQVPVARARFAPSYGSSYPPSGYGRPYAQNAPYGQNNAPPGYPPSYGPPPPPPPYR
jgi:uncharacterized protein YcfJ